MARWLAIFIVVLIAFAAAAEDAPGDQKTEWITVENGQVTAETETEPMTIAARRAEAEALAIVPDDAEL